MPMKKYYVESGCGCCGGGVFDDEELTRDPLKARAISDADGGYYRAEDVHALVARVLPLLQNSDAFGGLTESEGLERDAVITELEEMLK